MIEIKEIRRQDYKKAQHFAIEGMHLNWYTDSKVALNLYARYFWDMELNRATRVYGAYVDNEFEGVLLADMKGEPKKYHSRWRTAYIKFVDWVQRFAFGDGVESYEKANQEMYDTFCKENTPDGEIVFLAANPESKVKGVGTALLAALEADEPGKLVYLYTDNACTYQFYEHRGFTKSGERHIMMDMKKKEVPLICLLYSKRIGTHNK